MNQNVKLEKIRAEISSGLMARYFKRPVLVLLEIVFYSAAIALAIICIWYYVKIDKILDLINLPKLLFKEHRSDPNFIDKLEMVLLLSSILPALLSFLVGRLITSIRKKVVQLISIDRQLQALIKSPNDDSYLG